MTDLPFSRIAIVNRGEAAVRLVHAAAELRRERDIDLTTIALHTDAETHAMFARMADETFLISSADKSPYLDYGVLEAALTATRADAAWVGWGFVAEHPEFADLCDRLGITFIGPSGQVMRILGDKIGAKHLAEEVGVPVAPWSNGPVDTLEQATAHAADIGYPLLVKATAGGGGRGIRRVERADELASAFERARDEALKSFGDATVFMEHLVTDARHVEVQIAGDGAGGAWALGVRDCSIQRRNQKIIEESASPVLSPAQNAELGKVATDLVIAADYHGVGTVEFLYQPSTQTFAFLEVNTRLQVEHPITELTTGVDIVKLQFDLAAGLRLDTDPPPVFGHAIEARLNAEDPSAGFAPAAGRIETLQFPSGPGIRVDTGVMQGDRIQPEFDAMVAKVMAWGRDRTEARGRLIHALEETVVSLEGGSTNKSFLLHLLNLPEVIDGSADTAWLDRVTADGSHLRSDNAGVAVLVAAAEAYLDAAVYARTAFFAAAARGRPRIVHEPVTAVDCRLRGEQYRLDVQRISPDSYRITVDGQVLALRLTEVSEVESRAEVGGRTHRISSVGQGGDHVIEVDHVTHRVSRDDAGTVRSPSPSLVISVNVEPGQQVRKGDLLLVLEAMKMETAITAPFDGVVTEVMTGPSVQVDAGTALLSIDGNEADDEEDTHDRIDFAALAGVDAAASSGAARCLDLLDHIRWIVLGYDTQPGVVNDLVASLQQAHSDSGDGPVAQDPAVVAGGLEVLNAFTDVGSLARNRRVDDTQDEEAHNPKEYLHQYLRALDVEAEAFPEAFRGRLERAFAHYGIDGLEPTLDLQRAAFRLFNAQKEAASHEPLIAAVLDGLRLDVEQLDTWLEVRLRDTLDDFVTATQLRFPNLGNVARNVRYDAFDQPQVEARKSEILEDMRSHLRLVRSGLGDDTHMDALVHCPETVIELLVDTERLGTDDDPMLDVLFHRFYRVTDLQDVQEVDGRIMSAAFVVDGQRRHVVAALTDQADAHDALAGAVAHGRSRSNDDPLSIDLYTRWDDTVARAAAVAAWAHQIVTSVEVPRNLRRITISGADHDGKVFHHTFRAVPNGIGRPDTGGRSGRDLGFLGTDPATDDQSVARGLTEDLLVRDCHPMVAERLSLPRFANFDLERLGSEPDVYAYKAVGRDNPRDTRLIAVAEIRDLGPIYDDDGRVVGLTGPERAVAACANAIRAAQTVHDPRRRLAQNRIVLYVWPTFDLPLEALDIVGQRLAAPTAGLGLEGIEVIGRIVADATLHEVAVRFGFDAPSGREFKIGLRSQDAIPTLDHYRQNVIASRQRGSIYPYELIERLTGENGTFAEHALDDNDDLVHVERPAGQNTAGIVAGIITTTTSRHPDGMVRVVLLGDPTKGLGSVAEAECRTIIAACDLATELGVPLEWYAVSAGARIAMDTGTENMDWISRALRRIIEFTQAGGEVNIVVIGINVGAQPYWNAEATMLMHTRGILIMTPDSAMVLTGKQSLDYSGGVSAEDNFGIGGYDRIMGPNGQAQYWAADIDGAVSIMLQHYDHAYVVPGERFPRPMATTDDRERDISASPHEGEEFATVGEIFGADTNPGRKKPFDIRSVMRAVADVDSEPMERWADMADAETSVVYEAHLGGHPVVMIGISSRAISRTGLLPADGPDTWTSGTLFPRSSKKIARAINAASGSRPLVVLANLSGFDGSPESLARWQLEYGAEIGRAITNFDGPITFCVVSRYHGGAFVVFSKVLSDNMEALAVEGTYASVLGGAPAAAVVFAREVDKRTDDDDRIATLRQQIAGAQESERVALQAELADLRPKVRAEKLGAKAAEFDAVHTVERARDIGSVDAIIPSVRLRPELIASIERGMARSEHDSV